MSKELSPVSVNILDKEYRVACPEHEKEALLTSANYLNTKMKEVRDTGKVIGVDRIAVMAALNMANELIRSKAKDEMLETNAQFGDDRRTEITEGAVDISMQDLIASEDVVVTISHTGYAKAQPVPDYRAQRRGGRVRSKIHRIR